MSKKRSHPPENAVYPWGINTPKSKVKYISVSRYCRKYRVPRSTVYYFISRKFLGAVYQKGKYGVIDVSPTYLYKKDCYYPISGGN